MGSVHLNNTSRRGRKWNTNVASAIHSQCRECRIGSKVDGTIKEMTIHGDVWSTIQTYWMFGKKPFDVVQRLLRETNGSGIFHHEIVFKIFFSFSLFFAVWLLGFLRIVFISCLEIEKNAFSLREHIPVSKWLYLHSELCLLGERVVLNKWNGQQ